MLYYAFVNQERDSIMPDMIVYLNGYREAKIRVESDDREALRNEFAEFLTYELDREVKPSELYYEDYQGWVYKEGSTEWSLEED